MNPNWRSSAYGVFCVLVLGCGNNLSAAERTENFGKDPNWHGHNNRAATPKPRTIRQDFGYSPTAHTGGAPGEIGGFITPAAEPAYYGKEIPAQTFDDILSASGKVLCAGPQFHVLIGFFNADTINEWRTPSTIVLRLQGHGEFFHAYVEYCTSRWRAGGESPGGVRDIVRDRFELKEFPRGKVLEWSLHYDPNGNAGAGTISVTLGDETAVCHLAPGHKSDGATFNRVGLLNVMRQADAGGEVWLDDLTINGKTESFDRDPKWRGFQNRRTYVTDIVRPRFDFGYSATRYAGGRGKGEIGGLIFRGDGRYPHMMAFYGDRLEELSLAKPLKASGKVALRRGVTDADVYFGFFHAEHSLDSGGTDRIGTPPDFLGVLIGGPSREGFMFSPAYRLHSPERRVSARGPYLLPNGAPHDWTLEYDPGTAGATGSITVTLDEEQISLPLPREHQAIGAHFNRFGFITTHTDGNSQHVYFDELSYTWTHAELPEHKVLRGHAGSVLSVAFSPDGGQLASGCRNETIRLWDAHSGDLQHVLEGHTADVYWVAFSPDGQRLVSGGGDQTIRVWDPRTAKLVHTLEAHDDIVRAVVFSPDGKILASTGADLTVRLWDVRNWKLKATLTGHRARVKSLTFSPDGKFLASAGDDKTPHIWDVTQATLHATWEAHPSPIESTAFSPVDELLATSSNDGTVRLWRAGTWDLRHTLTGHGTEVDSIAFSPDGQLLVSGAKDRTLKLWNPRTGELLRTLAAHEDRVESLAISADGRTLASGSGGQDATIKLWEVKRLK